MSYYPRWLKLTLVLIAASLLAGLYTHYRLQCRKALYDIQTSLEEIYIYKMETVKQWRAVRLDKASIDLMSQYNSPLLERWIQTPPAAEEIDALKLALETTKLQYQYNDVIFLDPLGKPYFRLNTRAVDLLKVSRLALADAIRKKEAVLTDIYKDPGTGMIQVDQVIPFFSRGDDFIGAVIYQYKGDQFLESYLPQAPPSPGKSVETYLVRPDGGSILYLSSLRYKKDATLNLNIPFDRIETLAVKAVKSQGGLIRGKDYRNMDVIAVVGPVKDTQWFLISQIDEHEVFASPRRISLFMLAAFLSLLALAFIMLVLLKFHKKDEILPVETAVESTKKIDYETILDGITEGCQIIDFEWRFIYANAAAARQWGCKKHELQKLTIRDLFPASEKRELFAAFQNCMDGRKPQYIESRLNKPDGTMVWHAFSLQPAPQGIFMLSKDITERKRVEAEKQQFVTAAEESGESVIFFDANGHIQYVNPAFEKITGFKKEEVIGVLPPKTIHGSQDDKFYGEFWDTIMNGKPWQGLYINQKKDGTFYREKSSIRPICDQSGNLSSFVAVNRDLTKYRELQAEKDKLQEQLFQVQKMESIGRLAGGVAHDFNNMLNVIQGHAELSLQGIDAEHPLYNPLLQIRKTAERSAELTNQLLAFARKQTVTPKVINLNDTINGLLQMLRRLIGERFLLAWIPGYNVWQVKMDPTQIHQILTNLTINAKDAMDNTGRITIETANLTIDEAYCEKNTSCDPGDYVMLAVSDEGCGMNKETQANIFEPFFTTKGLGKGTGLGLSTVYGIVKQNKGFVDVYSEPNNGTTFKIYIPRHHGESEKPEERASTEEIQALTTASSKKTILLVEDESEVMDITRMMLERLGHRVLPADTPGLALSIAEKHGAEIDLLIVDVVMPEMTGLELSDQLLLLHPGLKVLYMSGYTADIIAHHGVLDKDVHLVQKPITFRSLILKIDEVLGQS
ncbi:MAG: PAS domain S-box protein [Chitinispirillaceae bacterium]|nr:PAS domain S-box protein [Chitinispirillaceae bacterium]